jgi:hypothetical protein
VRDAAAIERHVDYPRQMSALALILVPEEKDPPAHCPF